MNYLSLCSGICAATVAWQPLGWKPVAFAEIEPFPSAVLAHRYPGVPNLGDMTRFAEWDEELLASVDLLVGGTPCQAFSVAGLRGSLADERGNLTLTYVQIADLIDSIRARHGRPPVIFLWENVPGVLSTPDNAYGCFLGGLAGSGVPLLPPGGEWEYAGYVRGPLRTIAWRALDAQYFGVPQRRHRVFVVASARDGFRPEEILFESGGLRRDTPPRREAGEGTARGFECSPQGGSLTDLAPTLDARCKYGPIRNQIGVGVIASTLDANFGRLQGCSGQDLNHGHSHLVPDVSPSVTSKWAKGSGGPSGGPSGDECSNLLAVPMDSSSFIAFDSLQAGDTMMGMTVDGSPPLRGSQGRVAVCFAENSRSELRLEGGDGQQVGTLSTGGGKPGQGTPTIVLQYSVRRLTPRECERLQGFPDDYTQIPNWNGWRAVEADEDTEYLIFLGLTVKTTKTGKLRVNDPDGPRYKALGNSMAVPCMTWIAQRIAAWLSRTSPVSH